LDTRALPARATLSNSITRSAANSSVPADVNGNAALNVVTNWEDKLDEILSSEKEDNEKARQMAEIFPSLPQEGQVEAAQHLSNLVPDEEYASVEQYLTNSAYSEDVLDVFMSDVLNRPNSIKLPALLAVARDSQNPKSGEAKDLLELFLEEDHGTDWNAWQNQIDRWLKDNPD
jgi:hypothetical protein